MVSYSHSCLECLALDRNSEVIDTADEVKKYIEINHNDILFQINKTIAEEKESEDDEAFLARFDDDGNLIGKSNNCPK